MTEVPQDVSGRRVSIVIPTAGARGRAWGTERTYVVGCVASVEKYSYSVNHDYVIVVDPTDDRGYVDELEALAPGRVTIVNYAAPFHFSRKINLGIAATDAEFVAILNDDMEITDDGWLDRLVGFAAIPDVGAVGAVLRYDDGTIQHAGIRFTNGWVSHAYYREKVERGSDHAALLDREVSAVTGACIVQRRAVWSEVGGLSPVFPLSYNDVDYCLKIREAGYRILLAGSVELVHFESKSRNPATQPDERARLRNRWRHRMQVEHFIH